MKSPSVYKRKHWPCVTRPALPARCWAVAYQSEDRRFLTLDMGWITCVLIFTSLLYLDMNSFLLLHINTVSNPLSTTQVILSIVRPVSAIPVAKITLRNPRGVVWNTFFCSLTGRFRCLFITQLSLTYRVTTQIWPFRSLAARLRSIKLSLHTSISSSSGRNTRMSPRIDELWMLITVYVSSPLIPYSGCILNVIRNRRRGVSLNQELQ